MHVKPLGLIPNGKQIKWRNLKRRSLLAHKKTKIKKQMACSANDFICVN